MRIPKRIAIFGFNLCASLFIGFSVYGIMKYLEEGSLRGGSLLSSLFFGAGVAACIIGVCYFGQEWDRRNAEESAEKRPAIPEKRGGRPNS